MLSNLQHEIRKQNHLPSAKSKSNCGPPAVPCKVVQGSLVYIKDEGDKTKPRERYIVTEIEGDSCVIQKLAKSLRNVKYSLKLTEIFPVTSTVNLSEEWLCGLESVEEDESDNDV